MIQDISSFGGGVQFHIRIDPYRTDLAIRGIHFPQIPICQHHQELSVFGDIEIAFACIQAGQQFGFVRPDRGFP